MQPLYTVLHSEIYKTVYKSVQLSKSSYDVTLCCWAPAVPQSICISCRRAHSSKLAAATCVGKMMVQRNGQTDRETDGRTPDSCIDLTLRTTRAMSINNATRTLCRAAGCNKVYTDGIGTSLTWRVLTVSIHFRGLGCQRNRPTFTPV